VIAELLIARKSTMAFDAEPEWLFSLASMAFSPKGVAALPIPSTFDDMFMIMAPIAG